MQPMPCLYSINTLKVKTLSADQSVEDSVVELKLWGNLTSADIRMQRTCNYCLALLIHEFHGRQAVIYLPIVL